MLQGCCWFGTVGNTCGCTGQFSTASGPDVQITCIPFCGFRHCGTFTHDFSCQSDDEGNTYHYVAGDETCEDYKCADGWEGTGPIPDFTPIKDLTVNGVSNFTLTGTCVKGNGPTEFEDIHTLYSISKEQTHPRFTVGPINGFAIISFGVIAALTITVATVAVHHRARERIVTDATEEQMLFPVE